MAIAALARISRWKQGGGFSSQQYLAGAERAFAHLQANNLKYDDDGKENIIDDYCALMAASELWMATDKTGYRDEARKRAKNLAGRMTPQGYFIANDANRPFWHASDAGLPVIALARYLDKETDPQLRQQALATIKQALDYNLRVTGGAVNPFGYARQSFLFRGRVRDGFFIPHENESGWWSAGVAGDCGDCGRAPGLSGDGRVRNQAGAGGFCERPDCVDPGRKPVRHVFHVSVREKQCSAHERAVRPWLRTRRHFKRDHRQGRPPGRLRD